MVFGTEVVFGMETVLWSALDCERGLTPDKGLRVMYPEALLAVLLMPCAGASEVVKSITVAAAMESLEFALKIMKTTKGSSL